MLLLASGSFGSAANATIFTKDFGSGGGSVVNLVELGQQGRHLVEEGFIGHGRHGRFSFDI